MKFKTTLSIYMLSVFFWVAVKGHAAISSKDSETYLLPLNCTELLPDNTPFVSYFELVGKGQVLSNKPFSRRVFKILALRDQLNSAAHLFEGSNPVDIMIRRTLCFYREQKDALQVVPYYDPKMVAFLSDGMKDLEKKVETVILDLQLQSLNKERLARRAKQNEALVQTEKKMAEKSAIQVFERINQQAAQKVKVN